MKKKCFIVIVLVLSLFAFSQEKNADIVVLLDNSGTMLPYYQEVNEKVLQGICENFVRLNDSFHLLSFTEKTLLEISQRINTQSDIEKIVSRFSLLYPLGPYSNFIEALSYSRQYVNSLNPYTQKVLVIVSDGIFNPPSSSMYYNEKPEILENHIQSNLNALQSQGILVYFIKAPFPAGVAVKDFTGELTIAKFQENADGLVLEGKSDNFFENSYYEYATNLQNTKGIVSADLESMDGKDNFIASAFELPNISTKDNLGKKSYRFSFPLEVENTSNQKINLQLDKVLVDSKNILEQTSFISINPKKTKIVTLKLQLPENYKEGEQILHAHFEFADKIRTNPQSLRFSIVLVKQSGLIATLGKTGLMLVIIILIIIIIAALLFIMLKLSKKLSLKEKEEEEIEEKQIKKESVLGSIDSTKVSNGNLTLPEIASRVAQIQKTNKATLQKFENQSQLASDQILSNHSKQNLEQGKKETSDELRKAQARFAGGNKIALPQFAGNENTLQLPSIASLKPHSKIKAANSKEKIATKKEGTIVLELYVEGQTKNIGSRNIHALSAGSRKSLGGGLSVFSIFFVKVPSQIAEIRYDGQSCSLALLQPKYFPEAESNIIEDCLNKPITVISDHGFITRIMFIEYESQTEKLNELLLSVVPHEDKKKYFKN